MRRQVRVKYAGVIFAALLFVLLVTAVEIYNTDRFRSMVPQNPDAVERISTEPPIEVDDEPECSQMENDFAAMLEQSRSCRVDSDCSLARFECPFECVSPVSTNLLDELKREEASFQQACNWCESTCPQTLSQWRAACVRQRCIVLDHSIDDLEEATLDLINESRGD